MVGKTHTLQKKNNIVSKVISEIWKHTYKFGIEESGNAREVYELDPKNGNNYWKRSKAKEVKNNLVAFEVIP